MKRNVLSIVLVLLALIGLLTFAACSGGGTTACAHSEKEWVEPVAATCTKDGTVGHFLCPDCNGTFDADGNPISDLTVKGNHTPALEWSFADGKHYHACANCNAHLDEANCTGGTATCTEQAVCQVCSNAYGETAAHSYTIAKYNEDHHWSECACGAKEQLLCHVHALSETVDPDCTDGGYDVYLCTCGHTYQDGETPATNHIFQLEWTNNSAYHWHGASCGCEEERSEYEPHSFVTTTTPATCVEQGYTTYTCSDCGYSYVSDYVNATGHNVTLWTEVSSQLSDAQCCDYTVVYEGFCSSCEKTVSKSEQVVRHTLYERITTPATCTTEGVKGFFCSSLGCKHNKLAHHTETYTDPNAHVWVEDSDGQNGLKSYHCDHSGCTATKRVAESNSATIGAGEIGNVSELEFPDAVVGLDKEFQDKWNGQDVQISVGTLDETGKQNAMAESNLSTEQQAQLADCQIYNFTMITDQTVSQLGGTATIRLPYTLGLGEDPNSVIVWYINNGVLTPVEAVYSEDENGNGFVTFKTDHFSYYTVDQVDPADLCELLHKHDETRLLVVDPTCTAGGYTICLRCGAQVEDSYVAPKGHNINMKETAKATCDANGVISHSCSDCGLTYEVVTPAIGHYYALKEQITASCQTAGSATYACVHCDHVYTVTTPKLSHAYHVTVIEATCEAGGYTEKTCTSCGEVSRVAYTEAKGHLESTVWYANEQEHYHVCVTCGVTMHAQAHVPGAPATEQTAQTCTVCEYTLAAPLQHTHDLTKVEGVLPTCTTGGSIEYYTCACGAWFKDAKGTQLIPDHASVILDAKGHTSVATDYVEPTCTTVGYTAGVFCSECNTYLRGHVEIKAYGHDYARIEKPATCIEEGSVTYRCNHCGDTEGKPAETIPVRVHQLSSMTVAPTCTEGGYTLTTCAYCDHSEKSALTDALGHNYATAYLSSEKGHWHACTRCDAVTDTEAHTPDYPEANEAHGITCVFCHYEIASILPHEHKSTQAVAGVAPTCTTGGHEAYYVCTCGEWFSDEACTKLIQNHTSVLIPALGHVTESDPGIAPTCTTAGYTAGEFCKQCRTWQSGHAILPALGHSYAEAYKFNENGHYHLCTTCNEPSKTEAHKYQTKVVAPTCEAGGYTVYTCHCGYSYTGDETKALGHSYGEWITNKDGTHSHICANDPSHVEIKYCQYETTVHAPTCTEDGYTRSVCVHCGYEVIGETVPATGHAYAEAYKFNENGHYHLCTTCNEPSKTEAHKYQTKVVAPTCEADGYTVYTCQCGYTYTDDATKALGHSYGEWFTNKDGTHSHICANDPSHVEVVDCQYETTVHAPTCTEGGYTDYVCRVCGHQEKKDLVDPHGHVMTDWESNGNGSHVRRCKYEMDGTCDYVEKVDCSYEETRKESTCTEDGFVEKICKVCHYGFVAETLPATGHSFKRGECVHCGELTDLMYTYVLEYPEEDGRVAIERLYFYRNGKVVDESYYRYTDGTEELVYVSEAFWVEANDRIYIYIDEAHTQWVLTMEIFEDGSIEQFVCKEHTFGVYAHKDPTCTDSGYTIYQCQKCGQTNRENIPAIGHSMVGGVCEHCGEKSEYAYTFVLDQFTNDGTVYRTKYFFHHNGSVYAQVFQVVDGNEIFVSDANAFWVEIDKKIRLYRDAEHTQFVGALAVNSKGELETFVCEKHEYVVTDEQAPTCTESGFHTEQCKHCGETIGIGYPALGHEVVDGVCTRCGVGVEMPDPGEDLEVFRKSILDEMEREFYRACISEEVFRKYEAAFDERRYQIEMAETKEEIDRLYDKYLNWLENTVAADDGSGEYDPEAGELESYRAEQLKELERLYIRACFSEEIYQKYLSEFTRRTRKMEKAGSRDEIDMLFHACLEWIQKTVASDDGSSGDQPGVDVPDDSAVDEQFRSERLTEFKAQYFDLMEQGFVITYEDEAEYKRLFEAIEKAATMGEIHALVDETARFLDEIIHRGSQGGEEEDPSVEDYRVKILSKMENLWSQVTQATLRKQNQELFDMYCENVSQIATVEEIDRAYSEFKLWVSPLIKQSQESEEPTENLETLRNETLMHMDDAWNGVKALIAVDEATQIIFEDMRRSVENATNADEIREILLAFDEYVSQLLGQLPMVDESHRQMLLENFDERVAKLRENFFLSTEHIIEFAAMRAEIVNATTMESLREADEYFHVRYMEIEEECMANSSYYDPEGLDPMFRQEADLALNNLQNALAKEYSLTSEEKKQLNTLRKALMSAQTNREIDEIRTEFVFAIEEIRKAHEAAGVNEEYRQQILKQIQSRTDSLKGQYLLTAEEISMLESYYHKVKSAESDKEIMDLLREFNVIYNDLNSQYANGDFVNEKNRNNFLLRMERNWSEWSAVYTFTNEEIQTYEFLYEAIRTATLKSEYLVYCEQYEELQIQIDSRVAGLLEENRAALLAQMEELWSQVINPDLQMAHLSEYISHRKNMESFYTVNEMNQAFAEFTVWIDAILASQEGTGDVDTFRFATLDYMDRLWAELAETVGVPENYADRLSKLHGGVKDAKSVEEIKLLRDQFDALAEEIRNRKDDEGGEIEPDTSYLEEYRANIQQQMDFTWNDKIGPDATLVKKYKTQYNAMFLRPLSAASTIEEMEELLIRFFAWIDSIAPKDEELEQFRRDALMEMQMRFDALDFSALNNYGEISAIYQDYYKTVETLQTREDIEHALTEYHTWMDLVIESNGNNGGFDGPSDEDLESYRETVLNNMAYQWKKLEATDRKVAVTYEAYYQVKYVEAVKEVTTIDQIESLWNDFSKWIKEIMPMDEELEQYRRDALMEMQMRFDALDYKTLNNYGEISAIYQDYYKTVETLQTREEIEHALTEYHTWMDLVIESNGNNGGFDGPSDEDLESYRETVLNYMNDQWKKLEATDRKVAVTYEAYYQVKYVEAVKEVTTIDQIESLWKDFSQWIDEIMPMDEDLEQYRRDVLMEMQNLFDALGGNSDIYFQNVSNYQNWYQSVEKMTTWEEIEMAIQDYRIWIEEIQNVGEELTRVKQSVLQEMTDEWNNMLWESNAPLDPEHEDRFTFLRNCVKNATSLDEIYMIRDKEFYSLLEEARNNRAAYVTEVRLDTDSYQVSDGKYVDMESFLAQNVIGTNLYVSMSDGTDLTIPITWDMICYENVSLYEMGRYQFEIVYSIGHGISSCFVRVEVVKDMSSATFMGEYLFDGSEMGQNETFLLQLYDNGYAVLSVVGYEVSPEIVPYELRGNLALLDTGNGIYVFALSEMGFASLYDPAKDETILAEYSADGMKITVYGTYKGIGSYFAVLSREMADGVVFRLPLLVEYDHDARSMTSDMFGDSTVYFDENGELIIPDHSGDDMGAVTPPSDFDTGASNDGNFDYVVPDSSFDNSYDIEDGATELPKLEYGDIIVVAPSINGNGDYTFQYGTTIDGNGEYVYKYTDTLTGTTTV